VSDPNDEHLAELERITAREAETPPHARLENEAPLRESWLALGRLLDAANDDFDEAALVAKLRPATPAAISQARPRARWIGAAAIAASLLTAAIAWRVVSDRDRLANESAPAARPTAGGSSLPETTLHHEHYAWDDSLDERIAEAGEQLIDTSAEWRGYDAPYAAVDQRLQDLTESLGDEPL
jgi:hypothetical protein